MGCVLMQIKSMYYTKKILANWFLKAYQKLVFFYDHEVFSNTLYKVQKGYYGHKFV